MGFNPCASITGVSIGSEVEVFERERVLQGVLLAVEVVAFLDVVSERA